MHAVKLQHKNLKVYSFKDNNFVLNLLKKSSAPSPPSENGIFTTLAFGITSEMDIFQQVVEKVIGNVGQDQQLTV